MRRMVLPQHVRGLKSFIETGLTLSLSEQEISHRITLDETDGQLNIHNGNARKAYAAAKIREFSFIRNSSRVLDVVG